MRKTCEECGKETVIGSPADQQGGNHDWGCPKEGDKK